MPDLASASTSTADAAWWRDAVIYQVYPRSWADGNGDGLGDLPGITDRLPHLRDLGVDAVWLSPFYTSPQHDAGYDVADYCDVDPRFGTLADFDTLLNRAHDMGLRVIVDIVPNHSSSDHEWFQAALAAGPGSPERARYLFRDGRGPDGELPPNNWNSVFGGPGWTRVTEADGTAGQWYLHLFDVSQPDFDWTNPEVRELLLSVLAFWLDRGVDGFRIDVAHGLIKADGLPDAPDGWSESVGPTNAMPFWDQPGVHEIYRSWRELTDSYRSPSGDRILCGEAWVLPAPALARYTRPDELHQSFNFEYLMTPWRAERQRDSISRTLASAAEVGAPQTWVLSNHDVVRHASRLGFDQVADGLVRMGGIGIGDPQPDAAVGLARATAATAVMVALPGSAYLWQGEELGLPEVTDLADEVRQDPTFARSGGTDRGRDGCRVPMPWSPQGPTFGFGPDRPDAEPAWLPQPAVYGELSVAAQTGVEGSTLELYRTLLRLRRTHRLGRGTLTWLDENSPTVLCFQVDAGAGAVTVLANLGAEPVALPDGVTVLVASGPLDGGRVPTDTTVWLA
ncbi:alpha-amylase family glycosyl hydrolase [Williamsia sp. CHRR-6]|uniref:glycoside hydrolase family 13 protein n=1 Tax=Williamsia sp. CHRR-6 TaxID=2835871 RepID=UPI001BDABAB1|nr:alpha-amylase family glycosyl hydrolase [Williamsia sp. CHRR-6]MBT0566954.1 glycoside hydrolase family 13 protein [Williamsia sp. CHRR-6]